MLGFLNLRFKILSKFYNKLLMKINLQIKNKKFSITKRIPQKTKNYNYKFRFLNLVYNA